MKEIIKTIRITDKNPIIRNHQVYGKNILPGLAYIDLLFQIFKESGYPYQELRLDGLSIYHPFDLIDNQSRTIHVRCSESKPGQWRIAIVDESEKLIVKAQIFKVPPIVFDEILDLDRCKQFAEKVTDISTAYEQCRLQQLVHTGFMKLQGPIYHSDEGILMDLSVDPEALATAGQFLFHPAMIDGTGVGSNTMLYSLLKGEQRLFIPLFYESFSASEPIQSRALVRIKTSSLRYEKELISMTVEFFNLTGNKVGELKNFTSKIVRQADQINPETTGTEHLELFLRKLWADQLQIPAEEVAMEIGYYEMGLDSPGLLEIVEKINAKLESNFPPTLLFEYTTIDSLLQYLLSQSLKAIPQIAPPALKQEPSQRINSDIAIIGMSGRYPKAQNLQEFWQNLLEGKDCITEIPSSRWDWREFIEIVSPSGKSISRWGGFINDPDCFDPQFFRISPREAEITDPQERLFLEVCWEAIEDSGYTPKTLDLKNRVGVFAGVMHKDYTLIGAENLSKDNIFLQSLNYAPIPNRVSYFCNFHGPSLAIDTVCSSSLTAVHVAIESLLNGECEAALAGGVNLSLHPNKYITYGTGDMLSSDGYCHTFGKGGDGYVPAEGVGVVVLKPLQKAIKDGDHIYAVVKASAINHVGTVSGITVPSPVAQAELIEKCFEKGDIDPRTISYVEAHGTGTSLGDPIEIQGLVKAFGKYTQDRQFCAIGSIKSNIGHAESAAGISGLTKVALQLHHRMLVPSLHSEELNPYLDLPKTPFYVQHETQDWKNGEHPLRAGISSFGATGSNAHVILEEYRENPSKTASNLIPIIPLSAKNPERLKAYAEKLLTFLNEEHDLSNLAYTLQVGREALEERVVFVIKDIAELREKLTSFIKGVVPTSCWRDTVKKQKKSILILEKKIDFVEIAKAWVKGQIVEWDELYAGKRPQRISVPTYPFAKEHYWIPKGAKKQAQLDYLHPLLHKNTSDLEEQRFTSTFTGQEFFLADHVVKGKKILPAVAYLEMARAAAEKAIREKKQIKLKEIVWLRPLILEERPVNIHIGLYPEEEIVFEIFNDDGVLYSQGRIELSEQAEIPRIDLEELKKNCRKSELSSEQCYSAFRKIGLEYGPAHRAIERMYIGDQRVLAKLSLADPHHLNAYTLHPGLLDAALQASMGLKLNENGALDKLRIPFALESIEIYGKCSATMWGSISYRGEMKADIDLWDDRGQLCAKITGISSRELDSENAVETLFFEPVWVDQQEARLDFNQKKVIRCDPEKDFVSEWLRVFDEVQTILKSKLSENLLVQVIAPTRAGRFLSAISALLKTAHLENPYFYGQLLEVDSKDVQLASIAKSHVLCKGGKWSAEVWEEIDPPSAMIPWKDGGVYLITGGLGGLGLIFAKEIAKRTKRATLILVGRSPQGSLEELESLGVKVIYRQVDISDVKALNTLMRELKEKGYQLNGILHSAGVVHDNFIIKKSREEVERVLAPKVAGTLNLDAATKEFNLDFFILFSSGTGAVGNVGQADYALANAFLNAFAEGRPNTLSILWPLWKEGGMVVDADTERRMRKQSGMVPISIEAGIQAFYRAYASGKSQLIVVEGESQKIRQFLASEPLLVASENKNQMTISQTDFREKAEGFFKKILSDVLKLPPDRIEASAPMEDYGIDSVMIIQMTNQLEKVFGTLSKTLFFENQNIRDLTAYFFKTNGKKLMEILGEPKEMPSVMVEAAPQKRERSRYFNQEEKKHLPTEIAIIGISGKYPQADNLQEFWKNLTEGRDCITEIPKERWDHDLYFDEDKTKAGKTYSKWGGFLNDIDKFNPLFFHISPKDAELIDPQERLFIECVYETLEDAGYTKENLQSEGRVAVYVGVMYEEYQLYGAQEQEKGKMVALSGNPSSIANRVSYFFNFHGISIALDTMCSSSLTALHLACENLRHGDCSIAIAGGVNLSVHPNKYLMLGQGKFVSSKGRCESFGVGGDGYVPGEGVGAVLLKPLAKAIVDGDHIYGIVKGTAVNHGGKTNGYSVPNPHAQADVIKKALQAANVDPRSISYIEAHGTGTSLGDPIEMSGLSQAFAAYTSDKQYCALGSVKSNIGHCESAAGIAGLTKILLQMKNQKLVPSLHSKELNPHIDFASSPFVVQQELSDWKRPVVGGKEYPRIAGLSGFGAGGSNAHVIIEEYIPNKSSRLLGPALIVLSAETDRQLKLQAERLLESLSAFSDADLIDIAYTLQVGREDMNERLALIADNISELQSKLRGFVQGIPAEIYRGARDRETLDLLIADEDMSKTIAAWIDKGKYTKIAKFWVKGMGIDWSLFYRGEQPRRVSLPTYPFAKDRYWVPRTKSAILQKERPSCFLTKQWEFSPLTEAKKEIGLTLIFSDRETAKLASEVSRFFPKHKILTPESGDWGSENIDGWIDLIGCASGEDLSIGWIQLLQKLIEQRRGLMLLGVTRGLEAFQNSAIRLVGASRAGLYRMLQTEYSYLSSRHLDVDLAIEDRELARLIADEFFSENQDAEVCYRKGKRYCPFLERTSIDSQKAPLRLFSDQDLLLITGGTRGLGFLCAEHFVTQYGIKRLALTGRDQLPAREHWDLLKNESSPQGQKIRAIMALEQRGVQVTVTTDLGAISGPIRGVIHCAGTTDSENPAFIKKRGADFLRVLEPKITGLQSLYERVQHEPLAFFILFSSVSAIIPTLAAGQSDYAMGNAYMDYFALAHRKECPIVSLQWPSWKETGMGEIKSKAYLQTGILSLSNAEGLKLLDHVVGQISKVPAVLIPAILDESLFQPKTTRLVKFQNQDSREWLVNLFSNELKVDPSNFDIDRSFQEYGVDSIILAQISQQISQKIGGQLDPSILYEYPTIRKIADWLSPQVPQTQKVEISPPKVSEDDIAVIGMSCRFAGADSIEAYWELLRQGGSTIKPIPPARWNSSLYAGLLDNVTDFDPQFFNISEEDAREMDPQAFLILEECLKLWYKAGYSPHEVKGRPIGVYIGGRSEHRPSLAQLQNMRNPILAVGPNYLAANVSQFFDLRGPSLVLDTACSSGLVAMQMAAQALRNHDIEAAIVGGVSFLENENVLQVFEKRGILSKEPSFHIFDRRSQGMILAEGVGVVLLKTLKQAIEDGDHIDAVIKAIAVNNDGKTAGPATPSFESQKLVMQDALLKSGKNAEDIQYVEVNGSGSAITDLLELKAIQAVYRPPGGSTELRLGSVKPNIGHSLCAEGIASFIKVALMLKYRQFVPFISGQQQMEHFDLEAAHFAFYRESKTWDKPHPVAAINCFADGGTNAHLVLTVMENQIAQTASSLPMPELKKKTLFHFGAETGPKSMFWKMNK